MHALVEAFDPTVPVPWRVRPFALDGTIAIIAGKGGAGKTWVIHEAADAVVRGSNKAGIIGSAGSALVVDAEMGEYLTTKRFAEQGYSTDIQVLDAIGMDLKASKEDRQLIRDAVMDLRPNLVAFDSLRALVPSAKENDSDDMGPVVTWMRWLVRESGAAGILIHHAGWKEDRTRGSSAIKDQADAVWYMSTVDEDGAKKLSCRGADLKPPRWSEPPDDIYMKIGLHGGLVSGQQPVDKEVALTDKILETVKTGRYSSGRAIADAIGVNGTGNAFTRKMKQLQDEDIIVQPDGPRTPFRLNITGGSPAV
jgi:hypothetical protein